jgi:hypothetical protein
MQGAGHGILRRFGELADALGFLDDIARSGEDFPADR